MELTLTQTVFLAIIVSAGITGGVFLLVKGLSWTWNKLTKKPRDMRAG